MWINKVSPTSSLFLFMLVTWYFIGNNKKMMNELKNEVMKKYGMSDTLFSWQGDSPKWWRSFYFLKKLCSEGSKKVGNVLVYNENLMKEDGVKKVDETLYRSLVGNLLYLTTRRWDIMFAASLLSKFMNSPRQFHFGVGKRVLRYIQVQGVMEFDLREILKRSWFSFVIVIGGDV